MVCLEHSRCRKTCRSSATDWRGVGAQRCAKSTWDVCVSVVFERAGYVKVRDGRNGFTCIVSLRAGMVPVCWDPEGANTSWHRNGSTRVAVPASMRRPDGKVEEGFKNGTNRAPNRRGGVHVVHLRYRIDDTGSATGTSAAPHVMLYAQRHGRRHRRQRGSPVHESSGPEGHDHRTVFVNQIGTGGVARDSHSLTSVSSISWGLGHALAS